MTSAFGDILREWRSLRRFSQLQLSMEAETSARHISFLESGRARPSREMVARLAAALAMPKGATNQAMNAAGFVAVYPDLPIDDAALAPVTQAVNIMLANHEPLPAMAIDRHWDLTGANNAALAFFVETGVTGAGNILDALVALGESDIVENWEEAALLALARVRTEILQLGGDHTLERYAAQIANHPRIQSANADAVNFNQAVIPTVFRLKEHRLRLFSTLSTFAAVQDVSASETRVELFFPADDATRHYFIGRAN